MGAVLTGIVPSAMSDPRFSASLLRTRRGVRDVERCDLCVSVLRCKHDRLRTNAAPRLEDRHRKRETTVGMQQLYEGVDLVGQASRFTIGVAVCVVAHDPERTCGRERRSDMIPGAISL